MPLVAVRELNVRFEHDLFRVELGLPRGPAGVVFLLRDNGNVVHGNALAFVLRQNGFGTAICHLLTAAERESAALHRKLPFGAEVLAHRLMAAVDTVSDEADLATLASGISVSGMAAASALDVAILRPLTFDAIACRNADLVFAPALEHVRAATLFLAVAGDTGRIRPMTRAFQQLQCPKRFEILQGGSPAFDDEHAFARVCEVTSGWMLRHVGRNGHHALPSDRLPSDNTKRSLTTSST